MNEREEVAGCSTVYEGWVAVGDVGEGLDLEVAMSSVWREPLLVAMVAINGWSAYGISEAEGATEQLNWLS